MSKRMQVILKDPEYREIQRAARSRSMSVAEWVRQALRQLQTIRTAARLEYPTAEIDRMLAEIDRGYGIGTNP
jgi:predicted transcriptional regulator